MIASLPLVGLAFGLLGAVFYPSQDDLEIIWADDQRTPLVIAAATLLEPSPPAALRVPRAEFLNHLRQHGQGPCTFARWGSTGTEEPEEPYPPLLHKLRGGRTAVYGKVQAVTPAWNAYKRYVVSLVTADVIDAFNDEEGFFTQGSRVVFEQEVGSWEIEGYRICTSDPPFQPVSVDDHVILVLGVRDLVNRDHVTNGPDDIYPVRGGLVYRQGFSVPAS